MRLWYVFHTMLKLALTSVTSEHQELASEHCGICFIQCETHLRSVTSELRNLASEIVVRASHTM